MNNVSGCYGASGLYLWGNGTHTVMSIMGSEEDVFSPKKVEGIKFVKNVQLSDTHIIVMCGLADPSRKREEPVDSEVESKKPKLE